MSWAKTAQKLLYLLFLSEVTTSKNAMSVCGRCTEIHNPIRFIQEPVGFFICALIMEKE